LGAVGLYVLLCQEAAKQNANGQVDLPAFRRLMDGMGQYSIASDLQALQDAGFISVANDSEATIVDWGEWVVAQGEAGAGAE